MPAEFSRQIKLGNFTYNLYSHSLLHFGQNVAYDTLKESLVSGHQELAGESFQRGKTIDPCTPRGYFPHKEAWKHSPSAFTEKNTYPSTVLPGGNFSKCRLESLKLLKKGQENCPYQTCYIGTTFIPKLQGKFLATENFFHTSKFFGLDQRAFLSHLMVSGEQFCDEDWSDLTQKYSSLTEDALLQFCFSSAYSVALLHDSLGIALDDHRIEYANKVHNIPLDWALGAFVLHSTTEQDIQCHSDWISSLTGGQSPPWLLILGISLTLIFALWLILKWRKPKLKTIYDLEKGKYIVTRIGRYS